jgi:peptidoglycan/LPS O-acetylase OafA/YrhL
MTVRGQTVGRFRNPWLLGTIAVGGLLVVRLGSGNGLVHDLATSASAFCILLLAANPSGAVSRVLSTPRLVAVGVFSYSVYLVHAPLVHLFWLALRRTHLSPDATFFVLAVICMPIIVLLSYGFHWLFERPFMRMKPAAQAPARPETAQSA